MGEEIDLEELKAEILGKKEKKEVKKRIEKVDEIVEIIRKRYEEKGIPLIEEQKRVKLEDLITPSISLPAGKPEDLAVHESPILSFLGRMYLRLRGIVDRIMNVLFQSRIIKRLDFELYAANIPLTGVQYAALATTIALITSVIAFLLQIALSHSFTLFTLVSPFMAAGSAFFITLLLFLLYPVKRISSRSAEAEKYLPFALRHLAVEIRAGMSLYQALKAVAHGNYGVFSEEIERTLKEIDEGKSTEAALSNLALRLRSHQIRRVVAQLVRALRIGGKLSDVIMEIARDISFTQRSKIAEYANKLNLYGLMFMFVSIVFPVMLGILSAIGYAPTGSSLLAGFAIPLRVLYLLYLLVFPAGLLFFLFLARAGEPVG